VTGEGIRLGQVWGIGYQKLEVRGGDSREEGERWHMRG